MVRNLKSIFLCILSITMLITYFPNISFALEKSTYVATFTQEESGKNDDVYKLKMEIQGFSDTNMVAVSMMYDSSVIVPIDASMYSKGIIYEISSPDKTMFSTSLNRVELSSYNIDNDVTGFNVKFSNTKGDFDLSSSTLIAEWYYKIPDIDALNKSSIRFPITDEEIYTLGNNSVDTAAIIISSSHENTYACYNPHSQSTSYANSAEINANLIYESNSTDKLTSVVIEGTENGLTITIPELEFSPATLQLKATAIGLNGSYTGTEKIITTWSIDQPNNTGAVINSSTGELMVDNLSSPGQITVRVNCTTETSNSPSVEDTAIVTITKANSSAQSIQINGDKTELIIPVDGSSIPNETATFTTTIKDQFGNPIDTYVDWSITPQITGVTINNGTVTVTNAAKQEIMYDGTEFTVNAKVNNIQATKKIIIKRLESQPTSIKIYRDNNKLGATDIIEKPNDENLNIYKYTAKVFDQYGEDITSTNSAILSLEPESGTGITFENGTLSVSKYATDNAQYILKATCGDKNANVTINITKFNADWDNIDIINEITYGTTNAGAAKLPPSGTANNGSTYLNGTFSVINPNEIQSVGKNKTIIIEFTADNTNPSYAGLKLTKSYTITVVPKPITVSAGSYTITKEYDGTTNCGIASGDLSISGIIASDEGNVYAVIETIPQYTSANVGQYQLDATATLKGSASSNYTLDYGTTIKVPATIIKTNIQEGTKPVITGIAKFDNKLTASVDGINSNEFIWQWYRDNIEIEYATNDTYTLTYADSNKKIHVVATVKPDSNYNEDNFISDPISIEKMEIKGIITFSLSSNSQNTISVGDTIIATTDIENNIALNYQWFVNGEPVNFVGKEYTVKQGDKTIYVVVTPVNNDCIGSITSANLEVGKILLTGTLNISGDNVVGSELTATLPNLTYGTDYTLIWFRNGIEIATCEKYIVTKDDKGSIITVKAVPSGIYTGEITAKNNISILATVPDAPVLNATAGNGQVTLNWTPAHNGGNTISGYILSYINSFGDAVYIELDGNTISHTITGLNNGAEYTFTLVAVNSLGNSQKAIVNCTPISTNSGSGGSLSGGSTDYISKPYIYNGFATVITKPSIIISGDVAKAEVTDATMDKSVTSAIEAAKKSDTIPVVNVDIDTKNCDKLQITLPTDKLYELAQTSNGKLKITSNIATLTIDNIALENILSKAGSKVTLSISNVKKSELNAIQQTIVGNAPVFDFEIISDDKVISDFGSGIVTVTVPYSNTFDKDNVIVYFIDYMGNVTGCNTIYNSDTKSVTFTTNHFSKYFISYDINTPAFDDVDSDRWSAKYIYDLYNSNIVSGYSNNMFYPTKNITRAEFVKILAGIAGVTSDELSGSTNFKDVASNSWYSGYVAWAVNNGITDGTSFTTFSPNSNITREQMATMIYRFVTSKGIKLPENETVINFTDANTFSSWATNAIYAIQKAGIISGFDNNSFYPKYNTTREQACKILSLLIDII